MKKNNIDELANALLVQKDQLDKLNQVSSEIDSGLDYLDGLSEKNQNNINELNFSVDMLLAKKGLSLDDIDIDFMTEEENSIIALSESELLEIKNNIPKISLLIDTVNCNNDWTDYLDNIQQYGVKNNIDFTKDPFDSLLSPQQKAEILQRVDDEFKIKKCQCDKYDYMIAATCGAIGGLIDAFFVKAPGEGALGKFTDKVVDKSVEKFAKACGWKGPKEGKDSTKSAISFLERNFRVNYDHRHSGDVDNIFNMSSSNHHLKSLAHSPSPIGLFFSILGQFTDIAYFVDGGKLISIDTGTMELKGGNFIAKVFCGFVNWLGHLMSDVAGSNGAKGRGTGIPIPFFELFQFINIGNIGEDKKTIAEMAIKIFEEGYDFRHGLAMAIPVLITELSIRLTYALKCYFYHKQSIKDSIKNSIIGSEIRRMLLVGHGTLCIIDITDAAIRSGAEPVNMLLHMNLIGWVRFAHLGFQEILIICKAQKYDIKEMDKALDKDLKELLY